MKKIERKELSSGPHVLSPLRRGRAVGGRSLGGRCPHYALSPLRSHAIHRVLGNCTPDQVLDAARGRDGTMDRRLARMSERISPAAATSLLQDHWKGRITEVDHFNGFVVRKGREKGIPTPVNEAVRRLMKRIERKEIASGLGALEPLLRLVNG